MMRNAEHLQQVLVFFKRKMDFDEHIKYSDGVNGCNPFIIIYTEFKVGFFFKKKMPFIKLKKFVCVHFEV